MFFFGRFTFFQKIHAVVSNTSRRRRYLQKIPRIQGTDSTEKT